jgi:uncharacterized protein (TIGR00369 family)
MERRVWMAEEQLNPKYKEAVAKVVNQSPYFSLLSMEIKDLKWGASLLEVQLEEKHLQPFGNVHGGVMASVVDAATFWATFPQVENGLGLTTVEIKVNYLAPVQKGKLIATGRCIKMGKTLALGETFVRDEGERLIAHGTSTMMVLPGLTVQGYEELPPVRS